MKKKTLIIIIITLIALIGLFLSTGGKRTDVYLKNFEVSKDGKTMKLKIGVSSSSGYVRKIKKTSDSMNNYYTFYSTYGINSKLGSKDTFEIELDQNIDEIYFYNGDKGYRLELIRKNPDSQEWVKINYSINNTFELKLTNKSDIVKVVINTGAQNNNYFEYNDNNVIEKIYNIFSKLETKEISKTHNPENPEKLYMVAFYNDNRENAIIDTHVEVYKKNGKYYAEQSYNGIYEISKEDFNIIESYAK